MTGVDLLLDHTQNFRSSELRGGIGGPGTRLVTGGRARHGHGAACTSRMSRLVTHRTSGSDSGKRLHAGPRAMRSHRRGCGVKSQQKLPSTLTHFNSFCLPVSWLVYIVHRKCFVRNFVYTDTLFHFCCSAHACLQIALCCVCLCSVVLRSAMLGVGHSVYVTKCLCTWL